MFHVIQVHSLFCPIYTLAFCVIICIMIKIVASLIVALLSGFLFALFSNGALPVMIIGAVIGFLITYGILSNRQTKTCPFCKERIKSNATVCRFCGRDLSPQTQTQPR